MAIDGHRSTFVGGGSIDQFTEMVDLSPNEKVAAQRWQTLKLQESLTSAEQIEFNNLTTQLSKKIFSAEKFNTLADCIVALEIFFRDNVEGYIETKQQEFDATLAQFSDQGLWSNLTTYKVWNTVEYNYETYLSKQNNNINHLPSDIDSVWWRRIAKRGATGIGIGLSFQGVYDNSKTYTTNQAVNYEGSIYYCLQTSVGNLPTDETYWVLFQANMIPVIQSNAPTSPVLGTFWVDNSTTYNIMKYYNGTDWKIVGANASSISITDSGSKLESENVEDALQEIATEVDNNKLSIDNLPKYFTASGTATAIIVTTGYFNRINNQSFTFIASANNSGSATTINADSKGVSPLYKPNSTTTPTLILGKAYTVWYNDSKMCFFIKASAEGNANPDDVLAPKIFSNENDTGLVGTLTLTGNATTSHVLATKTFYNINAKSKETGTIPSKTAQTYTPKTTNQTIAANQYLSGVQTIAGDADLKATNIKSGVNIFGVAGTVVPFTTAIKSVQRGLFTSTSSNPTTYTVPINAVDMNSAVLFTVLSHQYSNGAEWTRSSLANSTSIEVYARGANYKVSWQVVEFNNIKSIQRGISTLTGSDKNETLNAVNMSKSIVVVTGTTGTYNNCLSGAELTSETNLHLYRSNDSDDTTISWQVVEFK